MQQACKTGSFASSKVQLREAPHNTDAVSTEILTYSVSTHPLPPLPQANGCFFHICMADNLKIRKTAILSLGINILTMTMVNKK